MRYASNALMHYAIVFMHLWGMSSHCLLPYVWVHPEGYLLATVNIGFLSVKHFMCRVHRPPGNQGKPGKWFALFQSGESWNFIEILKIREKSRNFYFVSPWPKVNVSAKCDGFSVDDGGWSSIFLKTCLLDKKSCDVVIVLDYWISCVISITSCSPKSK